MPVGTTPIGSILFAAGRGERVRPLTDMLPKPALPLLDVPLGAFMLARLCATCSPVIVNVAHLPEEIETTLSPYSRDCPAELMLETPVAYGTAGTLAALRDRVADPVVTASSDVLADIDIAGLLATHESTGAPATVSIVEVASGADFEIAGGRVVRMIDRRTEPHRKGALFANAAAFSVEALDLLPDRRPAGLGETVLKTLAGAGELAVFVHRGYWLDVGTEERYLQASRDLIAGAAPAPPVPLPGKLVDVPGGRAYIGPGAMVEGRLGPDAAVLAGAVVEEGAEVSDAIVWPGARVHSGERLSGTIRTP
jgi:mannose-1-phosphate guanylyltransferase